MKLVILSHEGKRWVTLVSANIVWLTLILIGCEKSSTTSKDEALAGQSSRKKEVLVGDKSQSKVQLDHFRALQRVMRGKDLTHEFISTQYFKISRELEKLSTEALTDLLQSLDPEKASEDQGLISNILSVLGMRDPEAALQAAIQLPNSEQYSRFGFCEKLVKASPEAVCRWLAENARNGNKNVLIANSCGYELAKHAPDQALNFLLNCDESTRKSQGLYIIGELARYDADRALQAVEHFPPNLRGDAYTNVVRGVAMTDGAEAFELLKKIPDSSVGSKAYPTVFLSWLRQDPKAAGEALATIPASSIQGVFNNPMNLSALITRDAGLAMKALDQMVFTDGNSKIFFQAASEIGKKDPVAAAAWLQNFPDSPKKGSLFREVAMARAGVDPEKNVPQMLSEQTAYRNEAINGAATAWGRAAPLKALEYAKALPLAEQKLYTIAVLKSSSQNNLDATLKALSNNSFPPSIIDSKEYKNVLTETASSLAGRNPQKAVKWAASLPDGANVAAVSGVASKWASMDASATGEWIRQMPRGSARNAAIQALVGQIKETDPDAARQWTSAMSN